MTALVSSEIQASVGYQYAVTKGWTVKESGSDQLQVEVCPLCKHDGWHFYMCWKGNKDGLWACHRCGRSSNLRTLQEEMGDRVAGVDSRSEWAAKDKKVDKLPDVDAAHDLLMGDPDALDYLTSERGFTMDIIVQQRLGLLEKHWFKHAGEVKALVIPYLVNGNCVYAKYRTLPPSPKDFTSPLGWEAGLYNGEILKPGIEEVHFVEGEADCLALMSAGVSNVVGVPGANLKKASWIQTLDEIKPQRIYVLYDSDRVGQKGAQELASRIGIERCLKLVLPPFEVEGQNGEKRPGKDVNEWLVKGGGSLEAFEELKRNAKQFDVAGVTGIGDALDDFERTLEGKDMLRPTYGTPWVSLNNKVGFEDGDVIDLIAAEKIGKSTVALNMLDYAVTQYKEPALFVCLEMTAQRLARKWVSYVTQTDDSPAKTDDEARARLVAMKLAIPAARSIAANREADLYFAYPQVKEVEDVFELIRQCYRRYGVKWVVIDNIQLLCDITLKNANHRTIHLSQISKGSAKLAKDLSLKMVRILQPKRVRDGEIVGSDDTDGSSQIAKDCDCNISFHRNRVGNISANDFQAAGYLDTETAFEPRMLATVGLSRYSGGGSTTLEFIGATSTVREYKPESRPERTDTSLIKTTETVMSQPGQTLVSATAASEI